MGGLGRGLPRRPGAGLFRGLHSPPSEGVLSLSALVFRKPGQATQRPGLGRPRWLPQYWKDTQKEAEVPGVQGGGPPSQEAPWDTRIRWNTPPTDQQPGQRTPPHDHLHRESSGTHHQGITKRIKARDIEVSGRRWCHCQRG